MKKKQIKEKWEQPSFNVLKFKETLGKNKYISETTVSSTLGS